MLKMYIYQSFLIIFLSGKMLMEHETMKLKEQEEMASKELKEWKAQLKPRKQVNNKFVSCHLILITC